MIKRILLFASVLFIMLLESKYIKAQDPEFTQFYANPMYLNPAFAGTARCPRMIMNYRNQWPDLSGTFVTYSASYDQHVDALFGGVGLILYNDREGKGTLTTTNVSGIYSYQLPVTNKFSLKFGVQGTYMQKSLDWEKLQFGDQIDTQDGFIYRTQEQPGDDNVNMVDFSAGILGFSKTYFFGFAAHHLSEPDESFLTSSAGSKLPRKYTGHAGAVIPFNNREPKDGSISPNVLFQMQQNFMQLNLGVYVTKGPFVGGLWYRNKDAFIVVLGMQTDMFKFGYSYDLTVSKLNNKNTKGSHEVSFTLQFPCKEKTKKFRTLSCPSF